MESVIRGVAIYLFLLVATRLAGRRSLASITPFDIVLLLVFTEATQQALLGDDNSLTNAAVVVATLLLVDVMFSVLKTRFSGAAVLLEGLPTVLVSAGKLDSEALRRSRIDLSDILEAGRGQGVKSLADIDCAILEVNGTISIVPVSKGAF